MWSVIVGGITSLVSGWFENKKIEQQSKLETKLAEIEAESDYDNLAQKNMQTSWKDEYLILIFTAPLIIGYFDEERAIKWVNFVKEMPLWYQVILFGIVAATFGLRWWFKDKQAKLLMD
ncbi:MAG: hypothetical protein GOVbin8609_18 [Prokaryotic dsDNA virus sp.]|nr:MAG: hypothetical protein GOVbin8609_18 [Prokaryotic dsDNA virus sp.]|tara:strand:+ start:42064 stop:42420 length:357 start_codon:yes stop_codon:yes gene_type:complete